MLGTKKSNIWIVVNLFLMFVVFIFFFGVYDHLYIDQVLSDPFPFLLPIQWNHFYSKLEIEYLQSSRYPKYIAF